MTEKQIINKVSPLYSTMFKDLKCFHLTIRQLENKHNKYIKRYFLIASLKLVDSKIFKKSHPVISNLLCYIAVETLCNHLAYFRKTKGIKFADFRKNCEIERKIKKSKEFQNFLDKHCPSKYKNKIKFKKRINDTPADSTFADILQYLYQRNRCVIVHKGLFRNIGKNTTSIDTFIDRNKKKCLVSISIPGSCLTEWLHTVVIESFGHFLLQ